MDSDQIIATLEAVVLKLDTAYQKIAFNEGLIVNRYRQIDSLMEWRHASAKEWLNDTVSIGLFILCVVLLCVIIRDKYRD